MLQPVEIIEIVIHVPTEPVNTGDVLININ